MRIVLIGQAPFGARTLEVLLDAGEDVAAVYSPSESREQNRTRSKRPHRQEG